MFCLFYYGYIICLNVGYFYLDKLYLKKNTFIILIDKILIIKQIYYNQFNIKKPKAKLITLG